MQTPSQKGLTGPTMTVLNDLSSVVEALITIAQSISVPIFLMGHSMGGAEVLQWAAREPLELRSHIRSYLAESPYLALHPAAQSNSLIATAGTLVAKVLPKKQMYVFSKVMFPYLDQYLTPGKLQEVLISIHMARLNPLLQLDDTDPELIK